MLEVNPDLKEADRQKLERLKILIENYQAEADRFIAVFGGKINDKKYAVLVKRRPEEFIPSQVQDVLEFLRKLYVSNGLEQLSFDVGYEYLNWKYYRMKEEMERLMEADSDASKMYEQLVEIVKIESELSEEHKTYRVFK